MKRGEIWTVAGGKDYAGKPRPVVILQDDRFDMTGSVTVCAFTTDPTDAPLFRLPIEPSEDNGLRAVCRLMVDKITTLPHGWTNRDRAAIMQDLGLKSEIVLSSSIVCEAKNS